MSLVGVASGSGRVQFTVMRAPRSSVPARALRLQDILRHGFPQPEQTAEVRQWRRANVRHLWRGLRRVLASRLLKLPTMYGQLSLVVIRTDGTWFDYGLASLRVVTDTGVGYIVDAFQNLVELENMKFHGLGTGGAAEAAGNTALTTELTTQYTPDNTRATGTTIEGATANIYRTVGTNTVDGTAAVTEHGIFSAATGGVMLDRSLFSVVNLASADSLQSTYDLTFVSGS